MYALRLIGDADASEDVVEDAFMKAWQEVDTGKVIDNFKAYIYRSVRNGCIFLLRNRKETMPLQSLTNKSEIEIPDPDEVDIDTSVRDARIWKAIDLLPGRCRS